MVQLVYISGRTPYEIGVNHGKKLKRDLNSFIKELKESFIKEFPILKIIPPDFCVRILTLLMRPKFPARSILEIRGISDGSGEDFNWVLFINYYLDLGHLLLSMGLIDLTWGCSGFITKDKEGELLVAKTFDMPPADILQKYGKIFQYDCGWLKHKFRFFGGPGTISGDYCLNSKGVTSFFLHGGRTKKWAHIFKAQLTSVFLRDLCERGVDYSTCRKYLGNSRPYTPFNCLLTDGKKKGCLIELFNGHTHLTEYKGKCIVCTNHFLSKEMDKLRGGDPTRDMVYIDSIARYATLKKYVQDRMSLKASKTLFRYPGKKGEGAIANSFTLFAMIVSPKNKMTYVAADNRVPVTKSGKYVKFPLRWGA